MNRARCWLLGPGRVAQMVVLLDCVLRKEVKEEDLKKTVKEQGVGRSVWPR